MDCQLGSSINNLGLIWINRRNKLVHQLKVLFIQMENQPFVMEFNYNLQLFESLQIHLLLEILQFVWKSIEFNDSHLISVGMWCVPNKSILVNDEWVQRQKGVFIFKTRNKVKDMALKSWSAWIACYVNKTLGQLHVVRKVEKLCRSWETLSERVGCS